MKYNELQYALREIMISSIVTAKYVSLKNGKFEFLRPLSWKRRLFLKPFRNQPRDSGSLFDRTMI